MIYAPLFLKAVLGIGFSLVLALLFQERPLQPAVSNSTLLILVPLLGGGGALVVGLLQEWRQRRMLRIAALDKSRDTEIKASGIEADERKDARATLLAIINQQNTVIQNHTKAMAEAEENARKDREVLTSGYCAQIAGLQSTINLQKDAMAAAASLAILVEQLKAHLPSTT